MCGCDGGGGRVEKQDGAEENCNMCICICAVALRHRLTVESVPASSVHSCVGIGRWPRSLESSHDALHARQLF